MLNCVDKKPRCFISEQSHRDGRARELDWSDHAVLPYSFELVNRMEDRPLAVRAEVSLGAINLCVWKSDYTGDSGSPYSVGRG